MNNEATSQQTVRDRSGERSWLSYTNTYRLDGSLLSTAVRNRDGSQVFADYRVPGVERNTVTLADGPHFIFEQRGNVLKVFDSGERQIEELLWTGDGPTSIPMGEPFGDRRLDLFDATPAVGAGAILFDWMLGSERPDSVPVLGFNAFEYSNFRIDVLEQKDDLTVCYYDVKTAMSTLTRPRREEIATTAARWFPEATSLVLVEVKVP